MGVTRMDNVGIVVRDLDAAIQFFTELGLTLAGRMPIEGEWAGRVTGLRDQRVEIALLRTPDGHGRLELSRFDAPVVVSDHRTAPVNALGYLRVMFAVEDLHETLARLRPLGARVVDQVVDHEGLYRLCYLRGPEGILIGLAQELRSPAPGERPRTRPADEAPAPGAQGRALDGRPAVAVAHVTLETGCMPATAGFFRKLGLRAVFEGSEVSVLELRGGTHLILLRKDRVVGGPATFDLLVDDLRATHQRLTQLGLEPSAIEARPQIDHEVFTVREPGGQVLTVYSTHVSGEPV